MSATVGADLLLDSVPRLEGAVCAQTDPEVFFPEQGASPADARRVCAECPVRTECLVWALEHRVPHGVWGGLTARERQGLVHADGGVDERALLEIGRDRPKPDPVRREGGQAERPERRRRTPRRCEACGRVMVADSVPRGQRPEGSVTHGARGLCKACLSRAVYRPHPRAEPAEWCVSCGRSLVSGKVPRGRRPEGALTRAARGMCGRCYQLARRAEIAEGERRSA